MEVILREHVDNLGRRGDVVKVADGYARNYLLPRKLALTVTEANRKQIDRERKVVEARVPQDYAGDLQAAQAVATAELPVTFALVTAPAQNFRGRLVDLANVVELDTADEPAVELTVAIDEPPPAPRAGAGILARVDCGRRPWGYVLFHDAARAAARWWY